jgi:hypothetical protein
LDGKDEIAQNILQSRTGPSSYAQNNKFIDSVKLMYAIFDAIYNRQSTEAAALVSSFNNKTAEQITPLLTEKNLTILGVDWKQYSKLDNASKTTLASKLAGRSFGSYSQIRNAIETAIIEILIEANGDQIKQKINAAITGTATVAQVNELLDLLAPLSGGSMEYYKLSGSHQTPYNDLIVKAKAGNYGFSAIKAYTEAGASPSDAVVMAALEEIIEIIYSVKQGDTYGALTVNNLPAELTSLSVFVYDATTLPSSSSALYDLEYVTYAGLNSDPGTSVTLGLIWPGSFTGPKNRNFVVVVNGNNDGSFYKVGAVAFNAAGNATIDVSNLTNVSSLGY